MDDKEMADFILKLRDRQEMPMNEDEYHLLGQISERIIELRQLVDSLNDVIDALKEWCV